MHDLTSAPRRSARLPRAPFARRALFAVLVVASTASAACGGAPTADDADALREPETDVAGARHAERRHTRAAACPPGDGFRVIRFVADGEPTDCPPIAGARGAWVYASTSPVRRCFATRNPERGTPVACNYTWEPSASSPHAEPDVAVLDAIPNAYLASGVGGGEAGCGTPSPMPGIAIDLEAGIKCPGPINGPATCDVCGAALFPGVVDGRMFVPASSDLRTLVVTLSNGTEKIVTLDASSASRGVVAVPLAPLPAGLSYVPGPALGYGYTPRRH